MKGPQDILYAEHVPLSAVNIHREVMFSLPCHEVVLSRHGLAISTGKQLENRRETSVRKGVDGTQQTLEVINDFFFFFMIKNKCLVRVLFSYTGCILPYICMGLVLFFYSTSRCIFLCLMGKYLELPLKLPS